MQAKRCRTGNVLIVNKLQDSFRMSEFLIIFAKTNIIHHKPESAIRQQKGAFSFIARLPGRSLIADLE